MSQSGIDHQKRYFRSLDELQQTPEFEQFLSREFPQAASEFPEGVSRRRWLANDGGIARFGRGCWLSLQPRGGCRVCHSSRGSVQGVAEYFATNFEWAGRSVNALVTNLEGRPIKVDGNADHPVYANSQPSDFGGDKELRRKQGSKGTDAFTQASILSLYDQDRIAGCLNRIGAGCCTRALCQGRQERRIRMIVKNSLKSWEVFGEYVAKHEGDNCRESKGSGLAILYEPTRSPSVRRVLAEVLKEVS